MEMTVIVLGVSRYSFQDDQNRNVAGTKVHYVPVDQNSEENVYGCIPQSATMSHEFFETMNKSHVPGLYKAKFTVQMSGRRPQLRVQDFEYVQKVDFNKLGVNDGNARNA